MIVCKVASIVAYVIADHKPQPCAAGLRIGDDDSVMARYFIATTQSAALIALSAENFHYFSKKHRSC